MIYGKIGSGDVGKLLQGLQTKGYLGLWEKFLSESPPYYNATASPIDALRTGAILEDRYLEFLPDDYFIQYKVTHSKMDVFTASIDFAKVDEGKVTDFDELKTIFLPDFLGIIKPIAEMSVGEQVKVLKKKFKANYNQVQHQLMCAELDHANLVFLSVESYDDIENEFRVIEEKDVQKFKIFRDETIISEIERRGQIFQQVKDHFQA